MAGCNLIGEIPESLGQLRNMITIALNENRLSGVIPSTLFNISSVSIYSLSDNQLEGSIPFNIGLTHPNLQVLDLEDNQFSGPIPTSLSNASLLESISLSTNYFTGKMPMLGMLSHLRYLSIAENQIQDDISFASPLVNCTNPEILAIGGNLVSGALPASIANLSRHLWALQIQSTQVHGSIPSGVGNLVNLNRLFLYDNNLEGVIPDSIGELHNLQELYLQKNRFTSEIPSSFGNITMLIELSLKRNQLVGSIPKSLSHCTNLLLLDLSNNNLNGSIPPEILNLPSLSISLNLSFNALSNSLPLEIQSLNHLTALDLSNNRLFGVIPDSISGCISLVQLHLQGNLFDGDIPGGLSALKGLEELDLSQNNLSGLIPGFLGELKLERLNLSFNRLHGEVPCKVVFANQSAISVKGNNDLCGGIPELNLSSCALPNSSKKNISFFLKILIPIGVVLFLCMLIFLSSKGKPKMHQSSLPFFKSTHFPRLSYADLLKATNGFSQCNLVGVGKFGSVYRGILNDGLTLVAVKVLNLLVHGASKSFMKECNALKGIRHRNLLKILSICESIDFRGNNFKALVYEFKENGSLEKWLHHDMEPMEESYGKQRNLDVIQRLNIAIDIAQALEYLHRGTESIIVHGDLKPSNIVLNSDMTAYVGDFGLAKVISGMITAAENSSSIGINGTIGYIPPEYGTSSSMSTKGDVYSYGILLLEIFTERRQTDKLFEGHLNLHNFVATAIPNCIEEIVDSCLWQRSDLNDEKVMDSIASVLNIGVVCSKHNPEDRISMTQVIHGLQKIKLLLS